MALPAFGGSRGPEITKYLLDNERKSLYIHCIQFSVFSSVSRDVTCAHTVEMNMFTVATPLRSEHLTPDSVTHTVATWLTSLFLNLNERYFNGTLGNFEKHIDRLSSLNYAILDVKSTRWHDDYSYFKQGVKDLEVNRS